MSSLLVSEDEIDDFSLPFEGRREDETSLVKAGSLKELLIVSSLPCVEEEEEMVRSSRTFVKKLEGPLF